MTKLDPVEALQAAFGDAIEDVATFRDEITVVVSGGQIADICRYCLQTRGLEYNQHSDVTGIDYFPQEPRFAVAYHLYSLIHNRSLRLKVYLPGDDPTVPSVTSVYPTANWFEREIYDLLGVTFTDHPDLRRILMPRIGTATRCGKTTRLATKPCSFRSISTKSTGTSRTQKNSTSMTEARQR